MLNLEVKEHRSWQRSIPTHFYILNLGDYLLLGIKKTHYFNISILLHLNMTNSVTKNNNSILETQISKTISSLDQLAMLYFMHPRTRLTLLLAIWAHWWLRFNLLSTQTPRSLSAGLLLSLLSPSLHIF